MRTALALLLLGCSASPPPSPHNPAPTPTRPAPAPAIDPAAIYLRCTDAHNRADWDAVAACYTIDAAVTPASSGSTLRGRDSIIALFKSFTAGFPDLTNRPTLLVTDGHRLISVTHSQGTHTVSLGAMPATMKPTSFLGLSITELDDAGLITRQVLYADNLNFMGQLGQWDGETRPVEPAPAGPIVSVRSGSDAAEPDHAALVRTAAAVFGSHDAAALTRLYGDAAVLDDQSAPSAVTGAAAIQKVHAELFAALPDATMTDLQVTAAGNLVVATYRLTGTHGGPWPRLRARSGTMRQLDLEVAALYRIHDGKIVHHTIFADGLAAAMQLGLFQLPGDDPPEGFKPPEKGGSRRPQR